MVFETVYKIVTDSYFAWTGGKITNENINFLDPSLHVRTPDLLYFLSDLQEQFSVPVFSFLSEKSHADFTPYNLTNYIVSLSR